MTNLYHQQKMLHSNTMLVIYTGVVHKSQVAELREQNRAKGVLKASVTKYEDVEKTGHEVTRLRYRQKPATRIASEMTPVSLMHPAPVLNFL